MDAADPLQVAPRANELLGGEWLTSASPGGWLKPAAAALQHRAGNGGQRQHGADRRRPACAARRARRSRSRRRHHLVGTGIHPDLVVDHELISPTDAHRSIAALHDRVGTLPGQSTHGTHVHVGMPSLEAALRVMDAVAGCVPLLIACSANSPVAGGQRAPWRSARSEEQRRMLGLGADAALLRDRRVPRRACAAPAREPG